MISSLGHLPYSDFTANVKKSQDLLPTREKGSGSFV